MRLLLALILGFLFLQCQNKSESIDQAKELFPTGEIVALQLDDSTSNVSYSYQYHLSDGKEYFFNLKMDGNILQIFDFSTGEKIKTLQFDQEGPNGVGGLFGFHVQSLDSIFLFNPPFGSSFYLANIEGELLKKFKYQVPDGAGSAFVHNGYMTSPPVLEGSKLAVNHRFPQNMRELTQEILSNNTFGYQINLETGETQYFNHYFPQDYLGSGLKSIDFSRAQGEDKVVYSLFGDHKLYYASSFDSTLKSVEAGSEFLDQTMPNFKPDAVSEEYQNYAFASSRYGSILYDPYREVYYRIAFPTLPEASIADIRSQGNALGPFVVMVLDSDLKVITERKFEPGKYHPDNVFVGKKGLYLSLQHPNNPENREEEMQFELIELR
ncbi:DUF4221 family protein [Algoriphagus taiwanensis]|uniref:DUF4221 domain-containing protein n=1 Tax=Algoriphagus taiwanensis TaxID=1445656 RepID=A0ABQ6PVM3_9BACT|nr:hypothetical protein Ataiwa_02760 [Algoriphagus taiwanensis]